eukprot:TRINITY_DN13548_c0_g1_i3.p1 TRINITY_DN13548_c0_g1~~TRINITY_DN13548_c0_g1_i3.p1  ORF type:complete len:457 (-),score=110.09 TRINITY_DN13548_c0_g1_i3:90-1460(-)
MVLHFSHIFVLLSVICCALCMPQRGEPPEVQCQDFADFGYYCVPYYQCDGNNKIITDGGELFDPRQSGDTGCEREPSPLVAQTSKCGKLLEVCCKHPTFTQPEQCRINRDDNDDDDNDVFGDDDLFGNGDGFGDGDDGDIFEEEDGDNDYDIFEVNVKSPGQCGKRNSNSNDILKSSADQAKFGEWPHVCAVLVKKIEQGTELKVYLCGGSLIEDGVILTAAHCLNDVTPADLIVRCGEWDTLSEDPLPFQEIGVDSMQIHPCFNNDNLHHDVALLLMVQHFTLTAHISPVCLPSPGTEWPGGQPCVSNGWGKDRFGAEGKYANILKEVRVPLVENQECQNLMRKNTRLGPFFELDESFLCAGGQKGVDTCKGDGGSPLVCEQSGGVFVQAGIVSWGIGCGGVGTPAIYAHVAKAACWIDSQVRCFYGDENSRSSFGYRDSQCPKIRCGDLNITEC